jgi:sugar phosphate isomerase/epimerase
MQTPIYLGSICLEPNRWKAGKEPTYEVSAWRERLSAAGFDGIELWENHYLKASEAEQAKLRAAAPMAIFNSYAGLGNDDAAQREETARAVAELGARAIKFNVGNDASRFEEYLANANQWAAQMPGVKLLCECHPGTLLETPDGAARAFEKWDAARFGAMIHPFLASPGELREWFRLLGPRIEHAHSQIRDDNNRMLRLDEKPDAAREALHVLREGGFAGSFTVEFTAGTSTENDRPEFVWESALRDLAFLRENW